YITVGRTQPVEPGRDDRVDRLRRADPGTIPPNDPPSVLLGQGAVVHQHPQHLLDEQGIAARALNDLAPDVLRPGPLAEEVADQALALLRSGPPQADRRPRPSPC